MDAGVHGGFTTGEPWLPLANDYVRENVADSAHTRSVLNLYRALIELRSRTPLKLVAGSYAPVAATGDVWLVGLQA